MSQSEHFLVDDQSGKLCGVFVGTAEEAAAFLASEFADGGVSLSSEAPAASVVTAEQAKSECRRRIEAVVDVATQTNILGALQLGQLSAEQQVVFQSGYEWVGQMRAAWPEIIANGGDIYDDANWPAVPAGVKNLAEEF